MIMLVGETVTMIIHIEGMEVRGNLIMLSKFSMWMLLIMNFMVLHKKQLTCFSPCIFKYHIKGNLTKWDASLSGEGGT